jgi:biopolymer transport protein ExbB
LEKNATGLAPRAGHSPVVLATTAARRSLAATPSLPAWRIAARRMLGLVLVCLVLAHARGSGQEPAAVGQAGAFPQTLPQSAAPAGDGISEIPLSSTAARPRTGFWQIVFSGGPLGQAIMLVLIGLSITALALAADNVRMLRRSQLIPPGLEETVHAHLASGDRTQAAAACQEAPSFLANVLWHGLCESASGWAEVEKAMEDAAAEQAARLYRRIEYLSVIGNLAPMVGLLGTVTGMLLAFKEVADTEGSAGAAQLADGIYQALVTTVAGLMIAIPALGTFALLRSRLDQLVAEASYAALHALGPLKQQAQRPTSPAPFSAAPPVSKVPAPPPLPPRASRSES